MNRKKLINKMILAAVVIFIISGAVCIYENSYNMSEERSKIDMKNKKIAQLTEQYQKYLDETAAKINEVTINRNVLSQIKSEIFKRMPKTKLYLWMSNVNGEFVFGVPAPVFIRLNKGFDKYRSIIEKDGVYVERNDFLLKLVDKHNDVKFSQFETGGQRTEDVDNWRYYDEFFRRRATNIALSSPVLNEEKQVIGDLYLKVDESNIEGYYYRGKVFIKTTFFDIFHVLCGISGFFLWFLLPTWIYIDAQGRDVKRVFLWVILTLVSYGFAFLIYLITRPPALKSFLCPECEKELNGTKAFCPYCGFDLSSTFCPQCQYQIKPEWQFCPNCRFDMKQKPPTEIPGKKEEEQ